MRIVIEIDSGELDVALAHPSSLTIAFPQAPAASPAPGVAHVVPGEVVEKESAADDAGPAPVESLSPGEPAAFIAPIVPALAETEAEDMDAGSASLEGLASDEPVSLIATTEPEAEEAGPAPTEDLAVDEPLAFIAAAEPPAVGFEAEATDAGPAPTEGLPSEESVDSILPTAPDSMNAEPTAEDAGPAPEALSWREVAEVDAAPVPATIVDYAAPAAEMAPDDLTVIDGIGPKISSILVESGITTFGQLAACEVDFLKQLLSDAGVGANADTWPEQAGKAATRRFRST